jgi:membrane protease YdiL (CAAX protease family)
MDTTKGLEIGRLRILHPGPLRWLRALGWMVGLVFLLALSLAGMTEGVKPLIRPWGLTGHLAGLAIAAMTAAILISIYVVVVRLGENREVEEFALGKAAGGLLLGLAIGLGMFCAVMALLVVSGAYQISGPHAASAVDDVTMAVSSGFTEELLIRAVIFRLLMRAFKVWPALVLSAALFGAGHLGNPHATAMAAIAIAVEAGLMLGAIYLATGNLWASIGVHAAWNFTQAYVFGAAVSGITMRDSLWVSTVRTGAPEWLSGGAFGPEASVPAIVVGSAVAIAALVVAYRRGNLRAAAD